MNHIYSSADQDYLDLFERYQVDPAGFHHREHLRIAYVLIIKFGPDKAFRRIKKGILALLKYMNAGNDKYHETITYAWLLAIHHFMQVSEKADCFESFIRQNPFLLDTSIINHYYSKQILEGEEARRRFVAPDLEPIPLHGAKPG